MLYVFRFSSSGRRMTMAPSAFGSKPRVFWLSLPYALLEDTTDMLARPGSLNLAAPEGTDALAVSSGVWARTERARSGEREATRIASGLTALAGAGARKGLSARAVGWTTLSCDERDGTALFDEERLTISSPICSGDTSASAG